MSLLFGVTLQVKSLAYSFLLFFLFFLSFFFIYYFLLSHFRTLFQSKPQYTLLNINRVSHLNSTKCNLTSFVTMVSWVSVLVKDFMVMWLVDVVGRVIRPHVSFKRH